MPNNKCYHCSGRGFFVGKPYDRFIEITCSQCLGEGIRICTFHQKNIDEFMHHAKQDLPEKPTIPAQKIRGLRAKLILEEAIETISALGFDLWYEPANCSYESSSYHYVLPEFLEITPKIISEEHISLEEIADGCADLSVVTIGTLSACGIADTPLLNLIDENNLSKFDGGETIRADGKLIKSPNWKAPDIKGLLKKMGYQPRKS